MKFIVYKENEFESSEMPCEGCTLDAVNDVIYWTIELETLGDLLGFCNKYGDIRFYLPSKSGDLYRLEICAPEDVPIFDGE